MSMHRHLMYCLVSIAALISATGCPGRVFATEIDACTLLAPAAIAKATGLTVGKGTASQGIPGVISKCTWSGAGSAKVILALGDAQPMQSAINSLRRTGGKAVPGIGTKAYGINGRPTTGGGYIIYALDSLGGFGVKIFGEDGTRARAVSLAKLVDAHRSKKLSGVGKQPR